jgi:hypothetical protein
LNEKAKIKDGHLFRNHCWRELGLGMIANNPHVSCAERMAFSRHSSASSHIAYIRAGHNSDFAFQKAVSGAPMPAKKVIRADHATTKKLAKATKKKLQTASSIAKKVSHSKPRLIRKVARKATPPQAPSYMKAPPKSSISPPATRAAVRKSKRAPMAKKRV